MQTIVELPKQPLPFPLESVPEPIAAPENAAESRDANQNPNRDAEPRVHKWTKDEYYRMSESGFFDGKRVELIEGEIIEMASMNAAHATTVRLTFAALRQIFAEGYVVDSQLPFNLGETSEPEPDATVIKGGLRDFIHAHPRDAVLIVEVSDSTLRYDRTIKQRLYAQHQIQEYWIVNINQRCLEVYRRPIGDAYTEIFVFYEQDRVSPAAKPDAQIAVRDLLP